MIPTIDNPGPFDAMAKARPGEPIFQLLGRDIAAPPAITEWCRVRRNHAIKTMTGEELIEELRQCADAEGIALAMGAYRAEESDEGGEPARRVAHSGVSGQSAEQRDRAQSIAATVEHLREAAYHVNEAGDLLSKLGFDALAIHKANGKSGMPVFDLADALVAIKEADAAIAPKRGSIHQPSDLPEPITPSFEEKQP